MYTSNSGQWRPGRPNRRDRASLSRQLLRRCFPCLPILRRLLHLEGPPWRRLCVRALLLAMAVLLGLLVLLLCHLFFVENATIARNLHLAQPGEAETPAGIFLPLGGSTPEELHAVRAALKPFTPSVRGPVPRRRRNAFLPSYFDLEERALPPLTVTALQAWWAHNSSAVDVEEGTLLEHARRIEEAAPTTTMTKATEGGVGEHTNHNDKDAAAAGEDGDFFHLLSFLHPPSQQQGYYRTAMNEILSYGTRVGGAHREPLLRHFLEEGLGQRYYDAAKRRYESAAAVHLSDLGIALLERRAASWPSSPQLTVHTPSTKGREEEEDAVRIAGWRWSLLWDNFTVALPPAVQLQPPSANTTVTLRNLIFQFPGGSQFRRKRAALPNATDVFVGHHNRSSRSTARTTEAAAVVGRSVGFFPDERHPLDDTEGDVYTQESFIGPGRAIQKGFYLPRLERGVPGTTAPLSTPGLSVPLKPSLASPDAAPVARQPVQHAVYAAHWDSMLRQEFQFLGACDSAMPVVFLMRTLRAIAVLTDVAEALTASYAEERVEAVEAAVVPDGVVVPGLTHTFRNATSEGEVRVRLSRLLSPAHHALLYQYFFARPYTTGKGGEVLVVDVRMWLDWVQHLPMLSVVLFDAEEAFERWAGQDHTYGSRHLARRWRELKTATQTRYSGGAQSLFASVDLFALYDIMGTAGTTFYNLFPTQSGIYYAALAHKEAEQRRRALQYSTAITSELLWRSLGTGDAKAATPAEDAYVRQLGRSVDVAVAAVDHRHVSKVLSDVTARPTQAVLPRTWLLYGAPHEMLTLHRLSLPDFMAVSSGLGAIAAARQYDSVAPGLNEQPDFHLGDYMEESNKNVFFDPTHTAQQRRSLGDPLIQDDHLHWLDTQRVLHLISFPFPRSWHAESDDGRDIHDGTSVDLANVLWSTVLELGHFWTGEGEGTAT